MEQLPQRGSVPQIGLFHTPRLRNASLAPDPRSWGSQISYPASVPTARHALPISGRYIFYSSNSYFISNLDIS